jgi:hydrogenase maturation protease
MKILLLGIGQALRGGDGAGLEAVQMWQTHHPEGAAQVQVEFAELPGLELLGLLDGREAAIIVDAVQSNSSSGEVIRLGPDELAGFTPEAGSAHGLGVAETLQLGKSLYPSLAECQITLIGITGAQFNLGAGLSPEVRSAMKNAADVIDSEIQSYLK